MKITKKYMNCFLSIQKEYPATEDFLKIDKNIWYRLYEKTGIKFTDLCQLSHDTWGFYLTSTINQETKDWTYLFPKQKIERNIFMNNILQYDDNYRGYFPYCKTKEDIIKLLNETVNKILND